MRMKGTWRCATGIISSAQSCEAMVVYLGLAAVFISFPPEPQVPH